MTMKQMYMKPVAEEIILSLNEQLASGSCEKDFGSDPSGWPPPGGPVIDDDLFS
jgi:hypothetical protein